jgi:predicted RNase H-like HicB family nuclease
MATPRLTLRALLYRGDGVWIAHCLELDLVADGATPHQAITALMELTEFQIETAMEEGDLSSIFRPAPPDIQSAFAVAQDRRAPRKRVKRVERFDVRVPEFA